MNSSQSTAGSSRDSAGISVPSFFGVPPTTWLETARVWAWRAEQSAHSSLQAWMHCAVDAYRALGTDDRTVVDAAAALATQGADELLSRVLQQHPDGWAPGLLQVGDVRLQVEFRQ